MVIICDSGGSKADWAAIRSNGSVKRITTKGINGVNTPPEVADTIIRESLGKLTRKSDPVDLISFYGAGCLDPEVNAPLHKALCEASGADGHKVYVGTDIEGAARALFGNHKGIAAILGTGSACALYDGMSVSSQYPSGGFILGDEGSGAVLGRNLLTMWLKGEMEPDTRAAFLEAFPDITYSGIVRSVYREPGAQRYLASFAPFIRVNLARRDLRHMVSESIRLFFKRCVMRHPRWEELPVGFTGSIAWHFRGIITEVANRMDVRVTTFMQTPISGLVAYEMQELGFYD